MSMLPRPAALAGLLWVFICLGWLAYAMRKVSARSATGAHDPPTRYPGRDPSLLWGIALIAFAPVASAVQYIATKHLYFWSGACVLLSGLFIIVFVPVLKRRWESRASRPAATTFRERSIVVQIVSILAVYGFFGARLWRFWDQPSMSSAAASAIMVFVLIGITICMIIINIAAHIALAFYERPQTRDERDRAVALRGTRCAYYVLAAGVWCVILLVIADEPLLTFCALMATFAAAELARLGSELYAYRFGA